MFKKYNGYTILEMMVVIVIVMILVVMTMRFGTSRIISLENQNVKEEFVNNYQQLISQNMVTNYYNNDRYDEMIIRLGSGSMGINYKIKINDTWFDYKTGVVSAKLSIGNLMIDDNPVEEINLNIKPYKIGCDIKNSDNELTGKSASFALNIGISDKYCFKIKNELCKIEQVECK